MAVTTIGFPSPLPVEQVGRTAWELRLDGVTQTVSNLTKPYWGPEGYTKGDLLAYYLNAAPWILPFLRDRALTLKRMPDGADGDFFYAKQAPDHVPAWVPRAPITSDDTGKTIEYLMAQDTASLLYVANLGCIEMHPWHSRIDALGHPDYAFFDLDPFDVDFRTVKDVALVVKALLDQLGLVGYPRTSGATGIHVYVPIDREHTFAEVRELIARACRLITRADPQRTTMEWQISDRSGRVFLDAGMNTEGRNIAAAYSVRPERGAPVSMPLRWDELEGDVEPQDFTMASVWPRLEEVGDAFTAVLAGGQTLWAAMEAVGLDVDAERRGPSHSLAGSASGSAGTAEEEAGELDTYRRMRDFGSTAEPEGATVAPAAEGEPRRFVIQHHLASRLHHDLRLERGGTLRSWALPKGLPLVPGLAHLAVQTEDHPMEYLTFAGDIPAGEYGGGQMRIWDTGTYTPVEWADGKVTVQLDGIRHRGEWHLFRTDERKADQWLVTRASRDDPRLPPAPPRMEPCLATGGGEPFDDDGWVFEVKWDGIRAIATIERPGLGRVEGDRGVTRLVSRNGNDVSAAYPELASVWERVLALNAVLDGEVVAMGPDGRPSFGLLQQRMHLRGAERIARARAKAPVTYVVFDLLAVDGHPLVDLPLRDRLALLDDVLVPGGAVQRSDVVEGHGVALFEAAREQRLEGVIAKRLDAPYAVGRRSPDWVKVKVRREATVVVGGWVPSSGGGGDLGSLVVGAHRDGALVHMGRVGTGFDAAERARLQERLEEVEASPFAGEPPGRGRASDGAAVRWVVPDLAVEIEYAELTGEGRLRAPAYVRQAPDVDPSTVEADAIT